MELCHCFDIEFDLNMRIANEFHNAEDMWTLFEVRRHFTCFAASFLNTGSGGGVGVIAATQPGLCGLAYDDEEILSIVFGSSDLNMFFFESYDEGISFSDMFVAAQNKYIDKIRGPEGLIIDYTTLHEFNLFGDPSLIIGG